MCLITNGVSRRSLMQAHTPGPSGESEVGVNAAWVRFGSRLGREDGPIREQWGGAVDGRIKATPEKGDASTRQDSPFASKL